jgi:flavin-dependent dehydrogenase
MVESDEGRISLSFCMRRDRLAAARHNHRCAPAGEAALAHIARSSRGVREALADAERDGAWLAAGPIRPGVRTHSADGVFRVGNLAGEAHPILAEGIGMAIQSAELLTCQLISRNDTLATEAGRRDAGKAYKAAWLHAFGVRVRAAACFATLAMQPAAASTLPLIERFPAILTLGARLSGKTAPVQR